MPFEIHGEGYFDLATSGAAKTNRIKVSTDSKVRITAHGKLVEASPVHAVVRSFLAYRLIRNGTRIPDREVILSRSALIGCSFSMAAPQMSEMLDFVNRRADQNRVTGICSRGVVSTISRRADSQDDLRVSDSEVTRETKRNRREQPSKNTTMNVQSASIEDATSVQRDG